MESKLECDETVNNALSPSKKTAKTDYKDNNIVVKKNVWKKLAKNLNIYVYQLNKS